MAFTDSLNLFLKGLSSAPPTLQELPLVFKERFVGCLPKLLQGFLMRRHRLLIVEPEGASARLSLATGQERETIGELDSSGGLPVPGILAGLSKNGGYRTLLLLPHEAILTRTVSFPAQVRGNLPQVMRYELDRLSPFQAHEVVFDFLPRTGPKGGERLTVDLALCRRDRVEGWIKRLGEAGSPIDRISWDGAWPRANLLPPEERPRRRLQVFSVNKLLLLLALLLALAVLFTPLWQKGRIVELLENQIRQVRAQAVAVEDLRQELERARQGSTAVLQQKLDQPPILAMLRELTDRLPDDTWIQSFEYNNGQVNLRGESGQATALIALLERAPGIDGVSFRSPVTQVARTGKERFYLSFSFAPVGEE